MLAPYEIRFTSVSLSDEVVGTKPCLKPRTICIDYSGSSLSSIFWCVRFQVMLATLYLQLGLSVTFILTCNFLVTVKHEFSQEDI